MAKDDLHVLVFKVLTYLYERMKEGRAVERERFKVENCFFGDGLCQGYLDDVCLMLEREGYTVGFKSVKTWGGGERIVSWDAKITFEGFAFMKENSMMKKVYDHLKEARGWAPVF